MTASTTRRRVLPAGLRTLVAALVALATLTLGLASPAAAAPQGYIGAPTGVGYFYGTFDQSPNIVLMVGGTAEDFCESNPTDPFGGEPGLGFQRIFLRTDGSVDIKVNEKNQPIHLYESDFPGAPPWIESVCESYFSGGPVPAPFASGTANLKVRVSVISADLVDVFNSVNGKAVATDGTEYKVKGAADLIVENGVPVGDPSSFVSFSLQQIRR